MFERPLKLTHNEDQKVFWTSDTHFYHNREFIYEKRGYTSRDEHTDGLINIINQLVRPQDILIHTGDFCLNISMQEFLSVLDRINCENIYYIWGNHNSRIRQYYEDSITKQYGSNDIEVYPHRVGKINFLGYYKEIIVNGQLIVLSHYPIQIFNQQQKGAWCLGGHSHYTNADTQEKCEYGKILDVGWDGFGQPLSFDDLSQIMSKKSLKKSDAHH